MPFCFVKYFLIFLLYIIYIIILTNYKYLNIKVCICTIGKNENKYAREYVEHYKKYGVDKIFIYDNNDIDGEKFETVLYDYIKNGYVEIINVRGKLKMQYPSANKCYNENKLIYNWFIFYDMDEFIHLTNVNNIKTYLSDIRFNHCNVIYLNQVVHTDNEQIYYNNKSLFERFPKSTLDFDHKIGFTKIILRGKLSKINITNPHILINSRQCNSIGKLNNKLDEKEFFNDKFYYDHFLYKSSEEYLEKLLKGDAIFGEKKGYKLQWFMFYFYVNSITKDKLDYFENKTRVNLSNFRKKLFK